MKDLSRISKERQYENTVLVVEDPEHPIYQDHITFMENFINKYGESTSLVTTDQEVTSMDINRAMAHYANIGIMLNHLYQVVKGKEADIELEYQKWYDEHFELAKQSVLDDYTDTKVKPNLKEMEVRLRTKFSNEYYMWQRKKQKAHLRVRAILRHLDIYKKFDSMLIGLSANIRQEMKTLSLEDRASAIMARGETTRRGV